LSFSAASSEATEIPHALRGLVPIHAIAGVYGIDSLLSLAGPFVELHILLAGIVHIAIGVGIYGAIGISKHAVWPVPAITSCRWPLPQLRAY